MTGREGARRLVHVGLGGLAWFLPLVSWKVAAIVFLLGTLANAFLLPRLPAFRLLMRPSSPEGDPGGLRGLVLYPLVLLGLTLLFRDREEPVIAAWLAMALGDGLAPLLAHAFGGPAWPWNARKRILPSCLAFGVSVLAMVTLLPPATALWAGTLGLLGESLPGPVDDNLTVPLLAAGGTLIGGG